MFRQSKLPPFGNRKCKRSNKIEDLAVLDAVCAMKTADMAVLVLDEAARHFHRQGLATAEAVMREGRALVVAMGADVWHLEEARDDAARLLRPLPPGNGDENFGAAGDAFATSALSSHSCKVRNICSIVRAKIVVRTEEKEENSPRGQTSACSSLAQGRPHDLVLRLP